MSLFACQKCGCVENTALCGYWNRGDGPALCSACDPAIGRWHRIFPRRQPTEEEKASIRFLDSPTAGANPSVGKLE